MGIRGILIDLDGPLLVDGSSTPRASVRDFVTALKERGLFVGAMTNQPVIDSTIRLEKSGLRVDTIHCSGHPECKNKPGGTLVAHFCNTHGLQPHQILVIGDDDFGFIEAMNGRAMGFHAAWGMGDGKYGIHVETPQEFLDYLDVFFMKDALWYAKYTERDSAGRDVILRTLIDANGAGSPALRSAVLQTLKDRNDANVAGASLSAFLMMHMIASLYLEGFLSIDRKEVLWQIYPGHSPASQPPPLIQAAIEGFRLFRSKAAVKELYGLTRWREALQSHVARQSAADRSKVRFQNQISSVYLAEGTRVEGKRIFVIDDFCTEGYSLEAARNLYFAAGARSVNLFAFGKYGDRYVEVVPELGTAIEPYKQKAYKDGQFDFATVHADIDADGLTEFTASARRLRGSPIAPKLLT